MKNRFIKVFILFISLFLININVNAEEDANLEEETTLDNEINYQVVINDFAELLTPEEEELLKEKMNPITEYGNIVFESITENYTSTDEYARRKYHEMFGTESGTLFLIDMQNRYIYIFSDGLNYRYITNSKADLITDNIYRYASREEYFECASLAYEQMYIILSGGKIAEPMKYASNILIAMIISFFFCFIFVISKAKIAKASNYEMIKNCDISFNVKNVTGQKSGTHRVYNPPSSSGGGSSGGGGGGGGGSSGGGGGHGF